MTVLVKEREMRVRIPPREEPLTPLDMYRAGLSEPKFREKSELSVQQLTDPRYAWKQIVKLNDGKLDITCSQCHHCR